MAFWTRISTQFKSVFSSGVKSAAGQPVTGQTGESDHHQSSTGAIADPLRKKPWYVRLGTGFAVCTALAFLVLAYFGLGALLLTTIDDNSAYRPQPVDLPAGGSQAVAMASALMDREVNSNGWKPSQPLIYPSALMDNMPNYQTGILLSVRAFCLEMKDYVARLRGSGGTDPDLDQAFSDFSYAPDTWFFAARFPFVGASSPHFYRDGIQHLRSYNTRVAEHQAVYEPRVDTLMAVLNRLSLSLGDASNDLKNQMSTPGGLFDTKADDVFYHTKGQAYGAMMILQGMRQDYDKIIRDRAAANLWAAMSDELKIITELRPLIVSNGGRDSVVVANHLAVEGVALERARQRMRELQNILQQ